MEVFGVLGAIRFREELFSIVRDSGVIKHVVVLAEEEPGRDQPCMFDCVIQ